MTRKFPPEARPRVVVSRCLGFEACRFNGEIIREPFLKALEPFVDFVFVCPEVEIGMGVPRDPVRLVVPQKGKPPKLIQPATGSDYTGRMQTFSRRFLSAQEEIDGFILKGASPTCAVRDAKLYSSPEKGPAFGRSAGLFGAAAQQRFPFLPLEDEGRLKNLNLREHFLTRIFTGARFRQVRKKPSMKALVQFHSQNKLLLMAYNQKELRLLGRISAKLEKAELGERVEQYGAHLALALARPPRRGSNINVLMHALGHVSDQLGAREKAHFLDVLEQYRSRQVPLSTPLSVLRSWLIRFEITYLLNQTFLSPFPGALTSLRDSGRGREVK